MAIYHSSTKPVSRGNGLYTRKREVEHSEIVLQIAAAKADINWARDRQDSWNVAEIAEKRKELQASIGGLSDKSGHITVSMCGQGSQKRRICVLIPKKPVMWDNLNDHTQAYVVPVGF